MAETEEYDSIEKKTKSREFVDGKDEPKYRNGRKKERTEAQKEATRKMLEAKKKKAEDRAEQRALELLAKKNNYEKAPAESSEPVKEAQPPEPKEAPPPVIQKKIKKPKEKKQPKIIYETETETESSSSEEEYTVVRKRKPKQPKKSKPIDIPPPRDLTPTSQGDTAVPSALPFRFV